MQKRDRDAEIENHDDMYAAGEDYAYKRAVLAAKLHELESTKAMFEREMADARRKLAEDEADRAAGKATYYSTSDPWLHEIATCERKIAELDQRIREHHKLFGRF